VELGRQMLVDRGFTVADRIMRVSRNHFVVCRDYSAGVGAFVLQDHAANGTWVNGAPVGKGQSVPVVHGDIITVVYENDVPRLQFRFQLFGDDVDGVGGSDGSQRGNATSDNNGTRNNRNNRNSNNDSNNSNNNNNFGNYNGNNYNANNGGDDENPGDDTDWIGRHSVTISAGLVLLASALAANWTF
jgi:hypothetical protein